MTFRGEDRRTHIFCGAFRVKAITHLKFGKTGLVTCALLSRPTLSLGQISDFNVRHQEILSF
jgi:hypothetical protein